MPRRNSRGSGSGGEGIDSGGPKGREQDGAMERQPKSSHQQQTGFFPERLGTHRIQVFEGNSLSKSCRRRKT
jgi:hypothetical protein